MTVYMILFLVGKDRPGIVDELSEMLFEQGANIEESRMAIMGGCFCVMALFSCPEKKLDGIKDELNLLAEKNQYRIILNKASDPSARPVQVGLPLGVELQAMDHPGIVNRVVHVLHHHQVNILSLNTQVVNAPLSGAPLFNLSLKADVPAESSISKIKADISGIADDMNLDVNFTK